jgi:hypothetical protein
VNTRENSFYITGGTLKPDAASYVSRQADDGLFENLMAGRFCYVLTPRQMGKSSLTVRTAERLRAKGVAVVILDLSKVGQNLTADQWYNGVVTLVGEKLEVATELEHFWLDHEHLGPLQRWMSAIREVVLRRFKTRLVIFVDEVDYVRSLPFSIDEFFAGIRELYNARAEDPDLGRLTFCLLGVAAPTDLVRDTRTTPFNIGIRIELTDFSDAEAVPLLKGLQRDQRTGARLLKRILYWTGGHPYLTQRLCQSVALDHTVTDWNGVDRLCAESFFSPRARERDDNLVFVRERLLRSEEVDRASLLHLYEQVCKRSDVPDDETSPLIGVLRLSGVTRSEGGYLYPRNRIYYRVFDRNWVIANMPDAELRRQRSAYRKGIWRAASVAAFVFVLIAGLAVAAVRERNRAEHNAQELENTLARLRVALEEAQEQRERANQGQSDAESNQRVALAEKDRAIQAEKRASEDAARAHVAERTAAASAMRAKTALDSAKESERRLRRGRLQDNNLIYELANRLEQISPTTEIAHWSLVKGNAEIQMRNFDGATDEFTKTLGAEPDNISALLNRSYLYNVVGRPEKAVEDSSAALKINPNSAVASLNLSIGLGLLGRYDEARSSVDKGIHTFMHVGYGEYPQTYVSPEIQEATGRIVIDADGETALTALHYELANLSAIAGREDFEATLQAADKRPRSANAYLFALNWAWLNYQQRPQDFGALAVQGALWERAGFPDRALHYYDAFLIHYRSHQTQKPDEDRYDRLARLVRRWKASVRSENIPLSKGSVPKTEQSNARDLFMRGYESLFSDGPDTLKLMTLTIQASRDNVDYRVQRARVLYERRQFVEARNDCDAILRLAPRTAIAYLYRALANSSKDLNAPSETITRDIQEATNLDPAIVPDIDDPNVGRVIEVLAESNSDKAINFLQRVAKYGDPSARPYLMMARLFNKRERFSEALEKIRIGIALNSEETDLYDERRRAEEGLCSSRGRNKQCLDQAEIQRHQASGYKDIGDAFLRRGKAGDALDLYTRAINILGDVLDQNTIDVGRDIAVDLAVVAHIIEERGTKAKAIEYLTTEFGNRSNLKEFLDIEIRRLRKSS